VGFRKGRQEQEEEEELSWGTRTTWHMCLTANVGVTSDIFACKSVVTVVAAPSGSFCQ